MVTKNNDSEIIEHYFKGLLDEDSRDEFLKRCMEDETFRNKVDEYKFITQSFRQLSPENEKKINDFFTQQDHNPTEKKIFTLKNYSLLIAVAASVVIVVSLSILYLSETKQQTPVQVTDTKIYSIPLYHSGNLGYSQPGMQPADTLPLVLKISNNPQGYYRFSDTLYLELAKNPAHIKSIKLTKVSTHFVLRIDSVNYFIRQGIQKSQKLEKIMDQSE